MRSISAVSVLAACLLSASAMQAQSASVVYRLGTDTVAIEQFTRTASKLSGEMVQRAGAAVVRVTYDMTLGSDGRPTAATVTRLNGDGTPVPNIAGTTRFRFTADSAIRESVFADSVQRRAFAIGKAFVNFPTYVYGPTELLAALKKNGTSVDSLPALGLAGNPGFTGLQVGGATRSGFAEARTQCCCATTRTIVCNRWMVRTPRTRLSRRARQSRLISRLSLAA